MVNLRINKNVEIRLSLEWIKRSFFTFREYPLQFILLGIVAVVMGILPFIGAFMTPLLVAQFMTQVAKVEHNQVVRMSEVFKGLFTRKTIIQLALINFCLSVSLVMAQYLVEVVLTPNISSAYLLSVVTSSLTIVFMLLMLLLQMTMWFAPMICLTHQEVSPWSAMWWSLKVTCYNIPTIFVYSILLIALTLLAILPLGLGLLIWIPILNITTYHVYYNVFSSTQQVKV